MPGTDEEIPLAQPTMSHHFNKLVDAKVLNNRKDGVLWFLYIKHSILKIDGNRYQKNDCFYK